ncbi:hypothetical protein [Microbulbifer halophilus]|uniref:hypothetical protein n=1 Tax=Microbulbifer halophilus TaxID=453963 RepID=UPI0036082D17
MPSEAWQDKTVSGVLYDVFPWHEYSAISFQTRECDGTDPASWKYFEVAKSSGEFLALEFANYEKDESALQFHFMLCEAAEALLAVDFHAYGLPQTVNHFHLYGPFLA